MRSAQPRTYGPAARVGRALTLCLATSSAISSLLPLSARAEAALEEIVVTAQRRTERLQDVPLAITAMSGTDLQDKGVRQAGDITAYVPNLLLNSLYGPEAQPTFALRGVTTQDFSQNQSSPIAMYVDEVYKPVGAVQALQIFDLDRVEVLRGPQGTLYGKNATGGAISFYSKNPSLTETDGYVTAGFGNYSAYTVRAAAGAPVVEDELGVRAAVLYEKRDGWVHSIVPGVEPLNGVDVFAGRITFLAKPSDKVTVALKVAVSRSGGTPYGAHAINVDPVATGFSGTIDWFDNGAKYAVHKEIRNDSVSLKLDWQASEHMTLTSVTGFDYGRWYEKSDDGGLPITVRLDDPNTYFSSVNTFSQEFRLASHDTGPFGWLAGLYYGRESTHATVQFHFFDGYSGFFVATNPGAPATLWGFDTYNSFDQVKESKALFLNTTYAVTPTVTLLAGIRYTNDKITIKNFYALEGGLASDPSLAGNAVDAGTTWWTQTIGAVPADFSTFAPSLAAPGPVIPDFTKSNSNVSVRAGLNWKPSDEVLGYLTFSQGYRGAAFNGQAFNGPQELTFAAPEKLNSIEVGVKADLWNKRGSLNAALFHYDYHDQQFLDAYTLPGGAGTGFRSANAHKSRVDGAELELRARATDDLQVNLSIGLMSSKYVDATLHAGQFVDVAHTIPRICCNGNQLIQAPDFTASAGIDWRVAQMSAGDLHIAVDANYYAKQYFDVFNTERDAQSAYAVANARVSLQPSGRRGFGVEAWIKNLANQKYLAAAINQADADTGLLGFDYALVGEPRTYGVDFTYRF